MPKIHGRQSRVYINGSDVSGYLNNTDAANQVDIAEVSAFGDTDKSYVIGLRTGTLRLAGFFDDTAGGTGVETVLNALLQSDTDPIVNVVHQDVIDAGGEGGKAEKLTSLGRTSPIGGAVVVSADFQADGGFRSTKTVFAKGTLTPSAPGAATSSYNGGTATAQGAELYAQIFSVPAGTPVILVEHSDDGGVGDPWATLGTFVGVASAGAPQAQRVTVTGTVKATKRATVSAGSVVAWVGIYQPKA